MKRLILFAGAALAGIAPAWAAPIEFSGRADVRGGYGSNPFLRPGTDRGAALLGFTISPLLRRPFATGSTDLFGTYSREEYLTNYGSPDTAQVGVRHVQQLNPRLSMTANASYVSSTSALTDIPSSGPPATDGSTDVVSDVDPLTIGSRTRRYQGSAGLAWVPSEANSVSLSGGYAHGLSNSRGGISSYDFYNGGLGYTRQINARLQLGGRVGYTRTESSLFPAVSSYDPGILLAYQFSAIWAFNGNLGVTFRRVPSIGLNSTGLGFNASLCGTYPTSSICVSGNRVTSASGVGGARVSTNLAVRISHQLTARNTASLAVSYVNSKAIGGIGALAQQFTQVNANLDRKISPRWLAGFGGRYQTRTQDFVGNSRAFSVSAHIGYLFGRLAS